MTAVILKRPTGSLFLFLFLLLAAGVAFVRAEDWPEFRGPTAQGHAAGDSLPVSWSESENIAWKAALPGRGWSSPVVAQDQIWLTTATDNGHSLRALALDRNSGEILHNVEVFRPSRLPPIHQKNSYASPTPIVEGDRVYVHFGTLGTAALNRRGEVLWTNQEMRYQHVHGPGGSPALADDILVINCDGADVQYVAGLDKNTGEIRWKTPRRGGRMAFSTPLVIDTGRRKQVVSPGGDQAVSYDPATGEELWWIRYDGFSGVPRPVFGHGLVYLTSGFYNPVLFAVRPDGQGDVTSSHIVWRSGRGVPLTPSPLLVGDEIYYISDRGVLTCLDAKTGEQHWRERLGGSFSASPVHAGEKILFLNESGTTTIIQSGRSFERLVENQLDGRTLASPAVADGAIYLRTASHLYRIEEQEP